MSVKSIQQFVVLVVSLTVSVGAFGKVDKQASFFFVAASPEHASQYHHKTIKRLQEDIDSLESSGEDRQRLMLWTGSKLYQYSANQWRLLSKYRDRDFHEVYQRVFVKSTRATEIVFLDQTGLTAAQHLYMLAMLKSFTSQSSSIVRTQFQIVGDGANSELLSIFTYRHFMGFFRDINVEVKFGFTAGREGSSYETASQRMAYGAILQLPLDRVEIMSGSFEGPSSDRLHSTVAAGIERGDIYGVVIEFTKGMSEAGEEVLRIKALYQEYFTGRLSFRINRFIHPKRKELTWKKDRDVGGFHVLEYPIKTDKDHSIEILMKEGQTEETKVVTVLSLSQFDQKQPQLVLLPMVKIKGISEKRQDLMRNGLLAATEDYARLIEQHILQRPYSQDAIGQMKRERDLRSELYHQVNVLHETCQGNLNVALTPALFRETMQQDLVKFPDVLYKQGLLTEESFARALRSSIDFRTTLKGE